MNKKIVLSALVSILLLSCIGINLRFIKPAKGSPKTWTVDDDRPADFHTVQEAINAARNGDTILVKAGIYYGNMVVNKSVSLIGESTDNTIINGSRVGNVLCVFANNVIVSNFKITGSGSGYRACGIYVNSSNNVFFNNIITKNNWGIDFDRAHSNTVSSNVISNQLIGHYIERSDNNTFKRNILTNNAIAFYSTFSDHNVFDENMIVENEGEGILVLYGDFCTFKRNTLINNLVAFWLDPVSDSLIINNSVASNREVGVRFHGYSYDNVIIGNNITGNKDGLFFHDTSNTTILHNTISKNEKGIAIYGGSSINVRLEIKYNSIINNTIGLWQSEYLQRNCAKVSQNNFINNNVQAKNEMQSILQWNAEYPSGGNYWSDYTGNDIYSGPYQNEIGSDGIGDTPYVIDENNQDNYPLMYPYTHQPALYYDLLTKVTELQRRYDSLSTTINNMQGQINSLNSTYKDLQESINDLQEQVNLLNSTLQEQVSINTLRQTSINELLSEQEAIIKELNNIRNLMFVFMATTIILMVATVYLAIRKPKIKP